MNYGYARVSSSDQNLDTQLDILTRHGVDEIVSEKVIGIARDRKLNDLIDRMQPGDILTVTRMDRLGRSSTQLLNLVDELKGRGIHLVVLSPTIDTRDEIFGKFFLTVMSAFSDMERSLIKEKQRSGIELAKQKGKYKGKPRKFTEKHMGLQHALELYDRNEHTMKEITQITRISRATIYRAIKKRDKEKSN